MAECPYCGSHDIDEEPRFQWDLWDRPSLMDAYCNDCEREFNPDPPPGERDNTDAA